MREPPFVDHADLRAYGEARVNLGREPVQRYRSQANTLRERLERHIDANPGFALVKMLHAGSAAKGTALSSLNDLDVAVYVRAEDAPTGDDSQLVTWMAERLREAYSNLDPAQIVAKERCVTISFRGSGLDVDVVPVLYEGEPDDIGYLVERHTGDRLRTSVTLHLEFVRGRKRRHPIHLAQVVRFVKWWAALQKAADPDFRCKSFMIELLLAHLADTGTDLSRYPEALEAFFAYVVKTELRERVAFEDYYQRSQLPASTGAPIEVFDPVNPLNNVASRYTDADRRRLVRAADEALSAIVEARFATTRARALECWQLVLGPTFRG